MLLCEKDCRQDACEHRKEACPCVPVSYVGNVNGVELITGRDIHWRENQPEVLKKCAARCHPSLNKGPAAMQVLKGRGHSDLTQHRKPHSAVGKSDSPSNTNPRHPPANFLGPPSNQRMS